jgi:hypothetical protein
MTEVVEQKLAAIPSPDGVIGYRRLMAAGKSRGRKLYGMASFRTKLGFVQLQDVVPMLARP